MLKSCHKVTFPNTFGYHQNSHVIKDLLVLTKPVYSIIVLSDYGGNLAMQQTAFTVHEPYALEKPIQRMVWKIMEILSQPINEGDALWLDFFLEAS